MTIKIGKFNINNYDAPYIIAELGANHNGQVKLAKELINMAKKTGCHCVKFQSWTKDSIFSAKSYRDNIFCKDDYRNRTDYTLEKIVEKFSLSEDDLSELKTYCDDLEIDYSCSVFSKREVDFLVDELKVVFIKIASMDINNLPFLQYIAKKGTPIVLSTGLSSLSDIDQAVRTIESCGNTKIIILHCVSHYPPKDENVNLNNIGMLRRCYPEYPIGFSDHTIGFSIPLAAVAQGACIIEKHLTLDKNMFGWDHKVSADKEEMEIIVKGAQRIHKALGQYNRVLYIEDLEKQKAFRRSLVSNRDLKEGEIITQDVIEFKRPGTGISPLELKYVIGRRLVKDVNKDELLHWENFL